MMDNVIRKGWERGYYLSSHILVSLRQIKNGWSSPSSTKHECVPSLHLIFEPNAIYLNYFL